MGCGTSKLKGDSFEGITSASSAVYTPALRDYKEEEEHKIFKPDIEDRSSARERNSFRAAVKARENKRASSDATSSPTSPPPANSSDVLRKEDVRDSSGKLSSLRQQWKNRKGVPEPRDPVTGRGLYTGLTLEEIKQYVGSTRPAGSPELGAGNFFA